jgi:hypothetical protein
MKLTKKTLHRDKLNNTLNTDSSFDESLSKPDLQCGIKNKSIQEIMKKVALKNLDNTLDDTLEYNKSTTVKKLKSINTKIHNNNNNNLSTNKKR